MIATTDYCCGSTANPVSYNSNDTSVGGASWEIRSYRNYYDSPALCSWVKLTNVEAIAYLAAAKDRDYWKIDVVFDWLWVYIPVTVLQSHRLMISISGWLARVGKRRKSGK